MPGLARATDVRYRAQMIRLAAVVVLIVALAPAASVAAAPAAPAAPTTEWAIDLPTGWRDDVELTKQALDKLNAGMARASRSQSARA